MSDPDFVLGRPKWAAERFRLSIDFGRLLETGDSVTGAAIVATEHQLEDLSDAGTPAPGFVPSFSIASPRVAVLLDGGSAGRWYAVRVQANTAQGDAFVRTVRVAVQ